MENGVNIEVFKGLISTAPAALAANQESVSKAETVGNNLLTEVNTLMASEAGKPNFEARKTLDEKLSKYLVRVNETVKVIKERRTPITGLFDDFKKMFTSLEARIDPKNDTFPGKIQAIRNKWAADQAAENQRIQNEQLRNRNIEAERIRVKSEIELQLKKYFLDFVEAEQNAMIYHFESLQLEAFDFESEKLINYKPVYPFGHFEAFKPKVSVQYIDQSEVQNILTNVKAGKFDGFCEELKETMIAIRDIHIEKLPSKKAELVEIAAAAEAKRKADEEAAEAKRKADAASAAEKQKLEAEAAEKQRIANEAETERKRLEAESEKRKAEEAAKVANETELKKAEASQQAETVQQVAQTNMLFEMQAGAITQDNVKEGCEIVVKNANGWLQIVAFYFEKEGLKKLPDDLAKMKLDQMRAFCEKHYLKTSEKIQSVALEYKDVYKAVNKK
jgi:hypothetical protein